MLDKSSEKLPPRYWPCFLIVGINILAWIVLWSGFFSRENSVQGTIIVSGSSFFLLFLWFGLFSRLSFRRRLEGITLVLFLVVLLMTLFRFTGVTGDLVPVLEWRWGDPNISKVTPKIPSTAEVVKTVEVEQKESLPNYSYRQFLGDKRNLILTDFQLDPDWKKNPPQLVWQRPMGEGWSAFAIQEKLAVTQEQEGNWEKVTCYHLETGELLWEHKDEVRFSSAVGGNGPRSTPTIENGFVYTMGATGVVNCLELKTGKQVWGLDVIKENQAEVTKWGISCSPLVLDNMVIVSVGGKDSRSLVAYDKTEGTFLWGGGDNKAGYSSPFYTQIHGVPQVIIFNNSGVVSHSPKDGKVLWEIPWTKETPNISQPLVLENNQLFVSSGYGVGSQLFQMNYENNEFSFKMLWKSRYLKAKFTNVVPYGDYIYGLDEGIFICLEKKTGKKKWKKKRYGHGQIILINDLILIQAESGEVALIRVNPEKLEELGRFTALPHKTWNSPALAGPYLLVRNSREAACYRLALLD